jgi:hypothetical protein
MGMGKPLAKTQALWRERLDRWRKSNKSEEEFAAIEGVKPSSLKWWRWRLTAADAKSKPSEPQQPAVAPPPAIRFVEVTKAKGQATAGGACQYEVVLRNGRVVRILRGFVDSELERLLDVADGTQR